MTINWQPLFSRKCDPGTSAIHLVQFTCQHDLVCKEKVAVKLSETEKHESYRKGKAVFPVIKIATVLTDLVGPESHFLFDALRVKCDWLTTPADTWKDNDNYRNEILSL